MMNYDDRLQQIQKEILRKKHLESQIAKLEERRENLSAKVWSLGKQLDREQSDVDKLEGISPTKFFYRVTGKLAEKLEKEKQEARAAQENYDRAKHELADVQEELLRARDELRLLFGCERRYETILDEKARAVKALGGETASEIENLEEKMLNLVNQKRELTHAASICSNALDTVQEILLSLDSAEGWGTWDIVGGGLISTAIKHSHLDSAQGWMERLHEQLTGLKTELVDVSVCLDETPVNMDGFLRFSDYFLEGVLADWMVLDRINHSQHQVSQTKTELERIYQRLNQAIEKIDLEYAGLKASVNQLVIHAIL